MTKKEEVRTPIADYVAAMGHGGQSALAVRLQLPRQWVHELSKRPAVQVVERGRRLWLEERVEVVRRYGKDAPA